MVRGYGPCYVGVTAKDCLYYCDGHPDQIASSLNDGHKKGVRYIGLLLHTIISYLYFPAFILEAFTHNHFFTTRSVFVETFTGFSTIETCLNHIGQQSSRSVLLRAEAHS